MKLYKKRWEVEPNVYGTHAFDALRLYASAVRRAGSFDREKIRLALESTDGFVGANGIFKMSEKDHMGLDFNAFRMVEIQGGEWVPIE
jgi:branched-chain amino acid transport system substrate-binding protein